MTPGKSWEEMGQGNLIEVCRQDIKRWSQAICAWKDGDRSHVKKKGKQEAAIVLVSVSVPALGSELGSGEQQWRHIPHGERKRAGRC